MICSHHLTGANMAISQKENWRRDTCNTTPAKNRHVIMVISMASLLDKVNDNAIDSHRLLQCRARQIISSLNISGLYQPLNVFIRAKG